MPISLFGSSAFISQGCVNSIHNFAALGRCFVLFACAIFWHAFGKGLFADGNAITDVVELGAVLCLFNGFFAFGGSGVAESEHVVGVARGDKARVIAGFSGDVQSAVNAFGACGVAQSRFGAELRVFGEIRNPTKFAGIHFDAF